MGLLTTHLKRAQIIPKTTAFLQTFVLSFTIGFTVLAQTELTVNNEYYVALASTKWKFRPKIAYFPSKEACLSDKEYQVIVRFLVNEAGNPISIAILKSSGNKRFDSHMIQQLQTARFYPFMKNGIAVKSAVNLPIKFICEG